MNGPSGAPLARAIAFKQKLRAGGVVFGAWVSVTDPAVTELLGGLGFDFLLVDAEHSAYGLETLQAMLMGLNGRATVPIVRAPWNDAVRIKQLLDIGFEGVMAPMVRTPEEVRALVAACRYPPDGERGFSPRRGSNYFRDIDAYVAASREGVFVMPQIEDVATLDRLDEYLAVPGVDAVAMGPNDMSGTAGLFRQPNHPAIAAACDRILAAAKARGLPAFSGIVNPPAELAALHAKGARIFTVTADIMLLNGAAGAIASARTALGA